MCDGKRATTEAESGRSPLSSPFILHPSSFPRSAFTLVELLVVIVIIGILMGLITGAASMARSSARRAGIGVEIANLDLALKKYRDQFGEYPPDCTDVSSNLTGTPGAVFMRHLNRAFPRFVLPAAAGSTPQAQFNYLKGQFLNISGLNLSYLDASGSLVFFLGGWPIVPGYAYSHGNFSGQMVYFSSDPTDPFDLYATNANASNYANIPTSRMQPLFQFDSTRLQQALYYTNSTSSTNVYWWQFFPNTGSTNGTTGNCPYIYFRAAANGLDPCPSSSSYWNYNTSKAVWGYNVSSTASGFVYQRWPSNGVIGGAGSFNADIVFPYYQFNVSGQLFQWYMPKDYQIICAGLDNHFGYRYSVPLDAAMWSLSSSSSNSSNAILYGFDNQTNFSTPTIEKTQ